MLTKDKIDELVAKDKDDNSIDYYNVIDELETTTSKNPHIIQGYVVYRVDGETGCEGGGEYIYFVLAFEKDGNTQYFRTTGTYSSWDGTEWHKNWEEVYPCQKTITVYEATKPTEEKTDNSWS